VRAATGDGCQKIAAAASEAKATERVVRRTVGELELASIQDLRSRLKLLYRRSHEIGSYSPLPDGFCDGIRFATIRGRRVTVGLKMLGGFAATLLKLE
jgi:hypothetical protein